MTRKNTLSALVLTVLFSFSGIAVPVKPVASEVTPLPEEIQSALSAPHASIIQGEALVTFHIDATGHVVLEEVETLNLDLYHHLWKTVRGMSTNDTTLVPGQTYQYKLTVK